MVMSQRPKRPFGKVLFVIVLTAGYACALMAFLYPVYMYSLG